MRRANKKPYFEKGPEGKITGVIFLGEHGEINKDDLTFTFNVFPEEAEGLEEIDDLLSVLLESINKLIKIREFGSTIHHFQTLPRFSVEIDFSPMDSYCNIVIHVPTSHPLFAHLFQEKSL